MLRTGRFNYSCVLFFLGALIFSSQIHAGFADVVEDFRVSDEDYPALFPQFHPCIAGNETGYAVVWVDYRGLQMRRYMPDGTPVGSDTTVSSSVYASWPPSISFGTDSNMVVVWLPAPNVLLAQRLCGSTLIDTPLIVTAPSAVNIEEPSVTFLTDSSFVVMWVDWRTSGEDHVYAQLFRGSAPIDTNFIIDDDPGGPIHYQGNPRAIPCRDSGFVAVWQDRRRGEWDICGQIFDGVSAVGANFFLNDTLSGLAEYCPSVSAFNESTYVAAWQASNNIQVRIFNDSIPLCTGFVINDVSDNAQAPFVSVSEDSFYVVTWEDFRNGHLDVYGQRLVGTSEIGADFLINDDPGTALQYCASVCISSDSSFMVAWCDERNDDGDIYIQRYTGGSVQGTNLRVNDDTGADQYTPKIAVKDSLTFIVWHDWRQGDEDIDIYGQVYRGDSLIPVGTNFRVNDDAGTAKQVTAAICSGPDSVFMIVWHDERDGNKDIYGQFFRATTPIGSNFKINDDPGIAGQYHPWVAHVPDSLFIVVWSDLRDGPRHIYGQFFNMDTPIGSNFRIDEGGGEKYSPSVGATPIDSNIAVVWLDARNGYEIYGQRFKGTTPVGSNFAVSDENEYVRNHPHISFTQDSTFVVVWHDPHKTGFAYAICGKIFTGSTAWGPDIIISSPSLSGYNYFPRVSGISDGTFGVVWFHQYAGNPLFRVYAREYDATGSPIDTSYNFTNDTTMSNQEIPDIFIRDNGDIFYTWVDCRERIHGLDIYAKAISTPIGIDETRGITQNRLPLLQIYPNPFEKKTEITFSVGHPDRRTHSSYGTGSAKSIELKIYDVSGRMVKEFILPTAYSLVPTVISWHGRDNSSRQLPSGIYFIHLVTPDECYTEKVVLLR